MISTDDLARIEQLLADPASPSPLASFRQDFPGLSLTRCDDSDMGGETPYREFSKFNLYLVDGRDHCWHITGDSSAATGIVVAARK